MRVLVIGGTQFIGRRIVAQLVERGDEVVLVHRGTTEPPDQPAARHLHADRATFGDLTGDIAAFAPEAVIDTNALSKADADAVLPHLPDVPLVVLSSMDTYRAFEVFQRGESGEPLPLDEQSPVRRTRYPHRDTHPELGDYEKLEVEPKYLARGAAVLRLGMVYGEHDPKRREEFVLRRLRAGRTRIPVGPANWLWTKVYVGDVATAALSAVDNPAARGETFNVGEAHTLPFADWIRQIAVAAGADVELVEVAAEHLPEDMFLTKAFAQHLLFSSAKATRLLGWRPADPADGLRRSVAWHLANPPDGEQDFSADDAALAVAHD